MYSDNQELPIITDLKELVLEFSSSITEEQQEKMNNLIVYISSRLNSLAELSNERWEKL